MGTPQVDTTLRPRSRTEEAVDQARLILSSGDVEQSLKIVLEYGCSPFSASAVQMRAMLHMRKGDFKTADPLIATALRMKEDPISYKMAGDSAFLQCKYEEAEKNYRKAIEIKPEFHETWHDLGVAVVSQGRTDECLGYFQRACELQPQRYDYQHHLSLMLLLAGQEAAGWDRMQARLNYAGVVGTFPNPERYWKGEPLAGKTIVVRNEQGWGDTIMFAPTCRGSPRTRVRVLLLPARAHVVVRVLFPAGEGVAERRAAADGLRLPREHHVPAAAHAGRRLPRAEEERAGGRGHRHLLVRLAHAQGRPPAHRADRALRADRRGGGRNLSLGCSGVRVASTTSRRFRRLPDRKLARLARDRAHRANLDLIITVDTAIAHLGGFLGVETWLLLPFVPDFRWGMQGERTKWYESMKLYRQPKLFDWDSVFARVAADLAVAHATAECSPAFHATSASRERAHLNAFRGRAPTGAWPPSHEAHRWTRKQARASTNTRRSHPYITGMQYVLKKMLALAPCSVLDIGSPLVQNVALACLPGVDVTVLDVRPHDDAEALGLKWSGRAPAQLPFEDASRRSSPRCG
jgi:hypothetical protein